MACSSHCPIHELRDLLRLCRRRNTTRRARILEEEEEDNAEDAPNSKPEDAYDDNETEEVANLAEARLPPPVLHSLKLQRMLICLLADTGAAKSCIYKEYYQEHRQQLGPLRPPSVRLIGASDSNIHLVGDTLPVVL